MGAASGLKALWLAKFARPAEDRVLYRTVADLSAKCILQIGVGDAQRATNLLTLASRYHAPEEITYIGIDLFEAAPQRHFSLKEAYRLFRGLGVQTRLIPGLGGEALARTANMLRNVELVLVSATHDEAAMARGWYFLPRCLTHGAVVLREDAAGAWHSMTLAQIEQLAYTGHRRAA